MFNFEFANIEWLALLLLLPIVYWMGKSNKQNNTKNESLISPSIKAFGSKKSIKQIIFPYLPFLRYMALFFLIIALARPRKVQSIVESNSLQGVDIIIAIDTSLSMLAQDLKPDRITALKKVAKEFVNNRNTDRIGIIVYSGESVTKVPLTINKSILIDAIDRIKTKELDGGTAIGVGLATSINHLKHSKAKSKIIILLTDGVNNDGFIDPIIAAKIASDSKIKVYTIGIGTNGMAMFPTMESISGEIMFDYTQVTIDEELLKYIAKESGGKYFRAQNETELSNIYKEIDQLEKSKIEEKLHFNYTELYDAFLLIALFLLCIEFVLNKTIFRTIV
ncbi:MAG: VWA domain-containing protein [Solirubrobacteraceae bacterium]